MTTTPPICVKGGRGQLLPLFGDAEQEWPRPLRVVLYMLGLFWCFAGVAIIADVFMAAIEKVTSKKLRLYDKKVQRFYTFELWNPTVANLTLMALGSSAPEILLNVIDIFAKEFIAEGLGPGTIVGSAAFNLLMIIAVCIVSIPDGQIRYIKEVPVYITTASWSVFAYLWLMFILMVTSPNVVEVWEGVMTFLFFPIIVFLAWLADKGYFGGKQSEIRAPHEDMLPEELAEIEAQIRKEHGQNLTNEQVGRLLVHLAEKPRSRAAYRVAATRGMFGGKRVKLASARKSISDKLSFVASRTTKRIMPSDEEPMPACTFSFTNGGIACFENAGKITLPIVRGGDVSLPARVYYKTKDGTAKAIEDYLAVEGWLDFEPGVAESFIQVEIVDDQAYEDDEDFYVVLSNPEVTGDNETKRFAALGAIPEVTVTIIDDDDAGNLCFFDGDSLTLHPGNTDSKIKIKVRRWGGGCGEVTAQYRFEGDTAVRGRDFDGEDGVVTFMTSQMEAYIEVTLKAVPRYDRVDRFRIILTNPTNGAQLDSSRDGGPDKNILTVMIQAEADQKDRIDKWKRDLQVKWQKSQVGHANWASQFKEAVYVNGGDDDDDEVRDQPSVFDYISHVLTMPWKLLFAIVPPVDYCGGWCCFFSSLAMIGVVTMLINDMASLLGCCMCLADDLTAITFVALGTSLPDTFASKTAAEQDPHADASVGNVTGSNCVNVFLGLGLPWMIASIKWAVSGDDGWQAKYGMAPDLDWLGAPGQRTQGFVVMADTLGYSVAIFSVCAVACIALLAVRRRVFGGELGGPKAMKWASAGFLTLLWLLYILLSALKCTNTCAT